MAANRDLVLIKDVLPNAYWKELAAEIGHPDFEWNYNDEISIEGGNNPFPQNPGIVGSCGFTHTLYVDGHASTIWPLVKPMVWIMAQRSGVSALTRSVKTYRCKANLQTQLNGSTPENHNMPHIDPAHFEKDGDNWIFLYYLNDADGDTFIFNETADQGLPEKLTLRKRFTPKANTGILFRDNIFHASSNPIFSRRRLNLNFNLLVA